jgi:hypothetical protein
VHPSSSRRTSVAKKGMRGENKKFHWKVKTIRLTQAARMKEWMCALFEFRFRWIKAWHDLVAPSSGISDCHFIILLLMKSERTSSIYVQNCCLRYLQFNLKYLDLTLQADLNSPIMYAWNIPPVSFLPSTACARAYSRAWTIDYRYEDGRFPVFESSACQFQTPIYFQAMKRVLILC